MTLKWGGIVREIIARVGFEPSPGTEDDDQCMRLEAVVRRMYTEAQAGSVTAANMIFERLDGKVPTVVTPDQALKVILELTETEMEDLFRRYNLQDPGAKKLLQAVTDIPDIEM